MLSSKQRSRLASLSQSLDPLVQLGRAGASEAFAEHLDTLLEEHELVKVRFMDFKESRHELSLEIAARTKSELIRVIGNTAIFFRRSSDQEKRRIELE